MVFFDYGKLESEYDRILEEADPCEECGSYENLALAVITELEHYGTIILLCVECHVDKEDETSSKELSRAVAS